MAGRHIHDNKITGANLAGSQKGPIDIPTAAQCPLHARRNDIDHNGQAECAADPESLWPLPLFR